MTQLSLVGTPNAAPELGAVRWSRDFEASLAQAGREGKPVFLLFQEIPGCATCKGFGADVLSHPLLVAAIEDCFVPVVVRNNVGGAEEQILKRYGEPAWNNPVVRFVDAGGNDLLARVDGVWDAHRIADRMIKALEKAGKTAPGYLLIARDETDENAESAVFAMHCFWEGEAALGAIDGVIATRAGFAGGAEVVQVKYLPAQVTHKELAAHAHAAGCSAVESNAVREAPASDQSHALRASAYAALDLTPMQRTKVNSAIAAGRDPGFWLTPAQKQRAKK